MIFLMVNKLNKVDYIALNKAALSRQIAVLHDLVYAIEKREKDNFY